MGRPGDAREVAAVVRFLCGPTEPGSDFVAWLDECWAEVEHVILTRTTQTNEPARCAALL